MMERPHEKYMDLSLDLLDRADNLYVFHRNVDRLPSYLERQIPEALHIRVDRIPLRNGDVEFMIVVFTGQGRDTDIEHPYVFTSYMIGFLGLEGIAATLIDLVQANSGIVKRRRKLRASWQDPA